MLQLYSTTRTQRHDGMAWHGKLNGILKAATICKSRGQDNRPQIREEEVRVRTEERFVCLGICRTHMSNFSLCLDGNRKVLKFPAICVSFVWHLQRKHLFFFLFFFFYLFSFMTSRARANLHKESERERELSLIHI